MSKTDAIKKIRIHIEALGVDTSHLPDEELEKRILNFNESVRNFGATMQQASKK